MSIKLFALCVVAVPYHAESCEHYYTMRLSSSIKQQLTVRSNTVHGENFGIPSITCSACTHVQIGHVHVPRHHQWRSDSGYLCIFSKITVAANRDTVSHLLESSALRILATSRTLRHLSPNSGTAMRLP